MITHQQIDDRLRSMICLCVEKIDADPALLQRVAANASRIADPRLRDQWNDLLTLPWAQTREKLLARTESGDQLRQNTPFGGLLSNAERLSFFKQRQ